VAKVRRVLGYIMVGLIVLAIVVGLESCGLALIGRS